MADAETKAVVFNRESIETFLKFLETKNRSAGTLEKYARDLQALYEFLPEEKCLTEQALLQWRDRMMGQGYAVRTVNSRLSAANSYLEYIGHRDLQVLSMSQPEGVQPELSRTEYLRLLSTARALEKERLYLWVKVFGCIGIRVQSLSNITREAVNSGVVIDGEQRFQIPPGLRQELCVYAEREGILTGPLFLGQNGEPVRRTFVTDSIRALSRDAKVPEEKASPRCLQRMFRKTQSELQARAARLVE